ncbi:MAG: short-chain fatty acid transporter [Desulfopila sp.]
MLWNFTRRFQFAADKVIPSSFVFCVILTLIVAVMALTMTDTGPIQLVTYWYDGLWTMISFAFQMTIMVVVCSAVAKAPAVERVLSKIARLPKTPSGAYVTLIVVTCIAGYINWAFATILAPIFSMYLSKNIRGCHFPFMITVGYSCMIMIQPICPSISVVALLASPDHFLVEKIGVIPVSATAFNPVGLLTFTALLGVTILVSVFLRPPESEVIEFTGEVQTLSSGGEDVVGEATLADRMNNSRILMWILVLGGVVYLAYHFANGGGLSLNLVIFIFLVWAMFFYDTPISFVHAMNDNMANATQVMIQFPFYGGIMGIMAASGLTMVMANGLIGVASGSTIYVFSYIAASIVNLFVPSQGGQWIVQGPVLVEAAQALHAHIPTIATAFMFGDEATNLLQPLYIIPALALVKMELKQVWGLMAFLWLVWLVVTMLCLLILPGLFI